VGLQDNVSFSMKAWQPVLRLGLLQIIQCRKEAPQRQATILPREPVAPGQISQRMRPVPMKSPWQRISRGFNGFIGLEHPGPVVRIKF